MIFEVTESRIQSEWLLALLDDGLADCVHQLADVETVLETVAVLSGKAHPLILDVNLVLLVVFEITSV